MPRYVTRAAWVETNPSNNPAPYFKEHIKYNSMESTSREVICDDDPIPTGLLDANGDGIYRLPEPIGFKLGRE